MTLIIYSLVKWTINSYNLHYSYKIIRDVINVGELVCDTVYMIPFANVKQWYTSNEKKPKTIFRLNIVIVTKVKIQSINYVAVIDRK